MLKITEWLVYRSSLRAHPQQVRRRPEFALRGLLSRWSSTTVFALWWVGEAIRRVEEWAAIEVARCIHPQVGTMNKDQVSGKIDQAVGKVKQSVGETIGNDKLANKGVVDQAKGAAKETWGNAKDAAQKVHDSNREAAHEQADETRGKVSKSVQNTKDEVNDKIDDFKKRHTA